MSIVSAIVDEDPEDNDISLQMQLCLAANETGAEPDEEEDRLESDLGDDMADKQTESNKRVLALGLVM